LIHKPPREKKELESEKKKNECQTCLHKRNKLKKRYKVVIVGAGPSAIFAALTLSNSGAEDIAMFERGKDIHERKRDRGMEQL